MGQTQDGKARPGSKHSQVIISIVSLIALNADDHSDESGWAWFIPLHNGTTSVGVVMNEKCYHARNQRPLLPGPFHVSATPGIEESTLAKRYISSLGLAPGVVKLITQSGVMEEGSVKSANDFSYSSDSYAGEGYRIVGDAGGMIAPQFWLTGSEWCA